MFEVASGTTQTFPRRIKFIRPTSQRAGAKKVYDAIYVDQPAATSNGWWLGWWPSAAGLQGGLIDRPTKSVGSAGGPRPTPI